MDFLDAIWSKIDWIYIPTFILIARYINVWLSHLNGSFIVFKWIRAIKTTTIVWIVGIGYGILLYEIRGSSLDKESVVVSLLVAMLFHKEILQRFIPFFQNKIEPVEGIKARQGK